MGSRGRNGVFHGQLAVVTAQRCCGNWGPAPFPTRGLVHSQPFRFEVGRLVPVGQITEEIAAVGREYLFHASHAKTLRHRARSSTHLTDPPQLRPAVAPPDSSGQVAFGDRHRHQRIGSGWKRQGSTGNAFSMHPMPRPCATVRAQLDAFDRCPLAGALPDSGRQVVLGIATSASDQDGKGRV